MSVTYMMGERARLAPSPKAFKFFCAAADGGRMENHMATYLAIDIYNRIEVSVGIERFYLVTQHTPREAEFTILDPLAHRFHKIFVSK